MDEYSTEMQWYMAVDNSATSPQNEYEAVNKQNVLKQPGIGADSSNYVQAKKTKKCLILIGVLLAVFITVSLSTGVLATMAYSIATNPHHSQAQANQVEQGVNRSVLLNVLSSELFQILNESVDGSMLNQMITNNFSSLSRKLHIFQTNLSLIDEQIISIHSMLTNVESQVDIVNNNISSIKSELNIFNKNLDSLASAVNSLQQTTNRNLSSLIAEINDLRSTFNRNNLSLTMNLGSVRNQVSGLQQMTNNNISAVRAEATALRTEINRNSLMFTAQLSSLNSQLNTDLGSVRNQVTSLNTTTKSLSSHVSSVQNQLNTVSNRLASPINLYQSCYQDTRSCTLEHGVGAGAEIYKPYCRTSYMSINATVS